MSYQFSVADPILRRDYEQWMTDKNRSRKANISKAASPAHVTAALKKAAAYAKQLAMELRGFADDIAVDRLERAIATNSLFLIEQAINFAQLDRVLERITQPELHESFLRGATVGVADLKKLDVAIDFRMIDPRAVQWAEQSSGKLVTNVTDSQKELVADLVRRAQAEGRTYGQTAKDLREFIGLLPQHAEAVQNYKADLLERGMAEAKVDRLGAKYANELLTYRTETIARHELLTATHEGQLQAIREAVMQGQLDPSVTQRVWTVADDERLCDICAPMDGVGVPADEPWTLEDGTTVWIPQEAHIQCRCSWQLLTNYDEKAARKYKGGWDESQHPRDERGRFGEGGADGATGDDASRIGAGKGGADIRELVKGVDVSTGPKGIGPATVTVYRVGTLAHDHVYFGATKADAEAYMLLANHQGLEVKEYTVEAKNVLVAKHHFQLFEQFYPGKTMQTAIWEEDKRSGFKSSVKAWEKVQAKLMNKVKAAKYDGVILTAPPPPADMEFVAINKKSARLKNWDDEADAGAGNFDDDRIEAWLRYMAVHAN